VDQHIECKAGSGRANLHPAGKNIGMMRK